MILLFQLRRGSGGIGRRTDLGSGALRRGGSSPFSRTNFIAPLEVYFFCLKLSS